MTERVITIRGTEHPNAHEAIQYLDCSADDRAILIGRKHLTVSLAEAHRLEALGIEFAYLIHHEPTGRIMTIPVNG